MKLAGVFVGGQKLGYGDGRPEEAVRLVVRSRLASKSFAIRSRAYVREHSTSALLNAPQQRLIPAQHVGE